MPPTYSGATVQDLDIQDSFQATALAHWNTLRGQADIPARKAFDPMDLRQVLPFIFLAEERSGDWFYRVVGSGIRDRVGTELTGKYLSSCDDAVDSKRIHADFEQVCAERRPHRHLFVHVVPEKPWLLYDRLLLPFGTSKHVTHILGVTHFECDPPSSSLLTGPLPPPPHRNPR